MDEAGDDDEASLMEKEAEILLTQAAKRRSQAEKGRGYQRVESSSEREARVTSMKAQMACSACKAHGLTVFGHWHADKACPYYAETQKHRAQKAEKKVFAAEGGQTFTTQGAEEDDESSDSGTAFDVMMTCANFKGADSLGMTDTCCAKTVVGEDWARQHMMRMWEKGITYLVVKEREPFRFGPGDVLHSSYALIFPLGLGEDGHVAVVRASVVTQSVPLLLSKNALWRLGATMYLAEEKMELNHIGITIKLVNTDNDQVGIHIANFGDQHQLLRPGDLLKFLEDPVVKRKEEVMIFKARRTGGRGRESGHHVREQPQEPNVFVPATCDVRSVSVQPSDSDPLASHKVEAATHGSPSSKVRLCESDCREVLGACPRVGKARCEPAEGDLGIHQTQASCQGPSTQLEARQPRQLEGHLCGGGGPGTGEIGGGQALPRLEEEPVHSGVGPVPKRPRGRGGGRGRSRKSHVCDVPAAHDEEDKPAHSAGLLGLSPVPAMPRDVVPDLLPDAYGKDPAIDDRSPAKCEQETQPGTNCSFKRFLEHCGNAIGGGSCSSRFSSLQHECDQGRNGGAASEAGGRRSEMRGAEVELRVERRNPDAQVGNLNFEPSEKSPELLSTSEIEKRILEGSRRRKAMKKGLARRLFGNVKRMMHSFLTFATVCAVAGVTSHSQRPDVLEVFGGQAEVSLQFAKWGWNALEPVDIKYGCDPSISDNRKYVMDLVKEQRPRLVVVSFPRRLWSPLSNLTYLSPQARRRLHKLRLRERPFLELCEEIFHVQLQTGGDALGENPVGSAAFKQPPIQRIINHPDVHVAAGHGCRFGVKHVKTGELLKNPTVWFSTSKDIVHELGRKCQNCGNASDHVHGQCMGGKEVTEHAGAYTREIAKAIHAGFIKTLKHKEPSRIRHVLRTIKRRIDQREPGFESLRWSERTISKRLKQWQAVFAVDNPSEIPQDMDVDSTALEDPGKRSEQESRLSEEGIHFEVPSGKRLDATARRTLRQLHLSLGHPSNKDLERFMRLGGVKQDVSEACGWIRCISCAHGKRPKSNRVGNIPPSQLRFGDEICLDCFHVHDSENRGHWFLSMLDRATSFHLITRINDHSPYTLSRTFNDSWCRWAGAPSRISVDMEGGFRTKEFWTQVADGCCPVVPIAGTAHWQAGKVERHGQTIKRMLEGVIRHGNVHGIENMEMAGHEVAQAKNELCREHGWSPNNLVFGREPRAFGEVHSNGNPYSFHPDAGMGGSDVAKRIKYRYHARLSYIKHQAKHMLLRTLEHRTRNTRIPEQGEMGFLLERQEVAS